MNVKDLLLPLSLALITTWAVQYFWGNRLGETQNKDDVRSGQTFVAPKRQLANKPLNTEIDFIDQRRPKPTSLVEVETDKVLLVFSTEGGTLDRLEFKDVFSNKHDDVTTIFPVSDTQREQRCFLVAFDEKTPYYYNFLGKDELSDRVELTYQADFDGGILQKKYTVYKDSYKIDLDLAMKMKQEVENGVTMRIFYPSPLMPDIAKVDTISALFSNEKGGITRIARAKLNVQQGIFSPTFFGADNRYFVHVLVDDVNSFIQRAYFHLVDHDKIFSILEGPVVKKDGAWKLVFYFGPKKDDDFVKVDGRLQDTLDYSGLLGPISRFLLNILKWLHKYFHSYGFSIIILTFLIKLLLLPFTAKSEAGMKKRTEFDKKLRYIQQKYKHDTDALARERAELIKKHGMPGLAGCLPLFLQLPIFIALSRVLSSSIEFYKAPFLWIHDLSAPDPYYVFPVLVVVGMLFQAVKADDKQRLSLIVMGLVFGAVTASMASGLSLYIVTNTLLSLLQSTIAKRIKI